MMVIPPASPMDRATRLARARRRVLSDVLAHVDLRRPLMVLKAPPGSGKTFVLIRAAVLAGHRGMRVAIATQTNNQADDLCRRLCSEFPSTAVVRFHASDHEPGDLGASVTPICKGTELAPDDGVVVATTSKWATTRDVPAFDVLLVDEAWQMAWADFMLLAPVAPRFVLVGDPGQIAPTVTIPVPRWETAPRAPHRAAPSVILDDHTLPHVVRALPVSTRLPYDTAALVRGFYDFPFESWADEGARRVTLDPRGARRSPVDGAIESLRDGSISLLTLPTPNDGVAPEDDRALADAAAQVVHRLLARKAIEHTETGRRAIAPKDIGLVATHRAMNGRLAEALGPLADRVRVDTPERWQGLERAVMVAVHPLSGVTRPSGFNLATGRLCVMASRHRVGLVIVSRDHVPATLEDHAPIADQAPGLEDACGRGHAQNLAAWRWLAANGRIVTFGG